MPNSQNRSNGKSGIVQPKRRKTKASEPGTEQVRSENKQGAAANEKRGGSGSPSGQGGRSRSGGNPNE